MAANPTNPSWIEPPPPRQRGMGCFGKGCLVLCAITLIGVVLFSVGAYLLMSHASRRTALPVQELPPQELAAVQERIQHFQETPPASPSTPAPPATSAPSAEATPTPPPDERQLTLSAAEINGLIASHRRSRGHAFVSISGNTANVQVSVPARNIPGIPRASLNGSFQITTNGPTPISGLDISKIEANGLPMPSSVLSMSYRGQSLLGYALQGLAPYHVSTAEIRDGNVILR